MRLLTPLESDCPLTCGLNNLGVECIVPNRSFWVSHANGTLRGLVVFFGWMKLIGMKLLVCLQCQKMISTIGWSSIPKLWIAGRSPFRITQNNLRQGPCFHSYTSNQGVGFGYPQMILQRCITLSGFQQPEQKGTALVSCLMQLSWDICLVLTLQSTMDHASLRWAPWQWATAGRLR